MAPHGWRSGTVPCGARAEDEPARAPAAACQVTAPGVSVRFDDVCKAFDETVVLVGVSVTVEPGEIFALLGPSGSGKTTMLRLLAGFEQLDRGRLLIAGESIGHLPPARRGVGMLFQSYALFPHLTVAQNVAFGLKVRRGTQGEIESRVNEMLELVRLAGFESRRIAELSGGQQQRVALARALAPRPRVLLLDEPLSNLDPALREETRADLRHAVKQTGITTVLVTHEQEEAFELGERIGLLNGGRLEQVGAPAELYRDPTSRFVATFVGRCSVLPGVVRARGVDGALDVRLEGQAGAEIWRCRGEDGLQAGAAVDVCVRPESLELQPGAGAGVPADIESERFTGSSSFYTVRLPGGHRVEVAMPGAATGLTGVGVVRQRTDEPPPCAFPVEGTGDGA